MSKTNVKVFALPTEKASIGGLIKYKGAKNVFFGIADEKDVLILLINGNKVGTPHHLYATTSETPKAGDYGYSISTNTVELISELQSKVLRIDNWKKVVVTDDKDLKYNDLGSSILNHKRYGLNWENHVKSLPQISPEFQQAWVREANKGTPILEALMEFTDLGKDACKFDDNHLDSKIENLEHNCLIFGGKCSCLKKIPKLNPQGYVTILPVKEKMYTKEQVRIKCMSAMVEMCEWKNEGYTTNSLNNLIDKWLRENL